MEHTYLLKKYAAWFIGHSNIDYGNLSEFDDYKIILFDVYELQFIPMPVQTRVHGGSGELVTLTNLVPIADKILIINPDCISSPLDATSTTLELYHRVLKAKATTKDKLAN